MSKRNNRLRLLFSYFTRLENVLPLFEYTYFRAPNVKIHLFTNTVVPTIGKVLSKYNSTFMLFEIYVIFIKVKEFLEMCPFLITTHNNPYFVK